MMHQEGNQSLDAIHQIELNLMLFFPDEYVPKFVANIQDLHRHRSFLKQISYTPFSFDFLLDIVLEAVRSRSRFRTLDCLRVLKSIKRDRLAQGEVLPPETLDKLFELYEKFVTHQNEEIRWAVNIFLKDQVLRDWQLNWLIENVESNSSNLNRVLRHPTPHPLLRQWATSVYQSKQHSDRQSEVIALLIEEEVPSFVDMTDRSKILWAIFYAKVNAEKRKRLLMEFWDLKSLDDLVEICNRLKFPDVLDYARQQLLANQTANAQST